MFGKLIEGAKFLVARRALLKNPIYECAMIAISAEMEKMNALPESEDNSKFKEELIRAILLSVQQVVESPNQMLCNREKLADAVVELAKYQVLVIPGEAGRNPDQFSLCGAPGITGELKNYLIEIAEKDTEIRELYATLDALVERKPTSADIVDGCIIRLGVGIFKFRVFNATRIALHDHHPNDELDWLRPFLISMCAFQEYEYRQILGLPDVLAERQGPLGACEYSGFLEVVLRGSTYPNFEWANIYKKDWMTILGDSPPGSIWL